MQLKKVKEILAASKKYEGEDKQALQHIAYLIRMNRIITAEIQANQFDTLLREECFQPNIDDEINPDHMFSLTATELLCKIVSGEIDPKVFAWNQLRKRGMDAEGKWVGFGEGKCISPFNQ